MFLAYLPCGVEYCETDFKLNGGRPVNKPAPTSVLLSASKPTSSACCLGLSRFVRSFMQDTPKCVCLEERRFGGSIRVVLSRLQPSSHGKAGWSRGRDGW